jgi:sulfur carrier protein ThiS
MSLDTYYQIKDALENLNSRNEHFVVRIINGEVYIEEFKDKACIIA